MSTMYDLLPQRGRTSLNTHLQNAYDQPVPLELATPTEFVPQTVQAMSAALNGLIADSLALYLKTKNYHWHVTGAHFRDYHLLFDEQAAQLLAAVDPLAERVRRIGGTTIRSISHISQLQVIEDDNTPFVPAQQMIQQLLADNLYLAGQQRSALNLADTERDPLTNSLLQQLLDETEQRIWFLSAIGRG